MGLACSSASNRRKDVICKRHQDAQLEPKTVDVSHWGSVCCHRSSAFFYTLAIRDRFLLAKCVTLAIRDRFLLAKSVTVAIRDRFLLAFMHAAITDRLLFSNNGCFEITSASILPWRCMQPAATQAQAITDRFVLPVTSAAITDRFVLQTVSPGTCCPAAF